MVSINCLLLIVNCFISHRKDRRFFITLQVFSRFFLFRYSDTSSKQRHSLRTLSESVVLDSKKYAKASCRPSECFRRCGKYFDGRQSILSCSIEHSVGRESIPSHRSEYSVGRCSASSYRSEYSVGCHDVCANCVSTLSAVRVFPQL